MPMPVNNKKHKQPIHTETQPMPQPHAEPVAEPVNTPDPQPEYAEEYPATAAEDTAYGNFETESFDDFEEEDLTEDPIELPEWQDETPLAPPADKYMLIVTTTSANTDLIKQAFEENNIMYEAYIAQQHKDICKKYNITAVPTLVIDHGDTYEVFVNAENIINKIRSLA